MTVSRHIRLHWQFMKMKLAERMAYPFDFFTCFIAYLLWQVVGPVFVLVMYYAGGQFPGWTVQQVIVLQAALSTIRGFTSMLLMGIIWNSNERIKDGTFDMILLRPLNTLWIFVMDSFDQEDAGQFVGGVIMLIIGITIAGGIAGSVPLFLLLALLGILFYFSLALFASAFTIKVIQTYQVYEFFTIINIFAGYPKTIYGKTLGIVFITVFPLLIAAHYPASALLGLPMEGLLLAIVAAVLLFIISLTIWYRALRSYTSAGG